MPVGVDGAAFEYAGASHRSGFGREVATQEAEQLRDAIGELVVEVPVGVFGPGIEAPVGEGDSAFGVADEDWAGIAGPDAVGGPDVEADLIEIGVGALEDGVTRFRLAAFSTISARAHGRRAGARFPRRARGWIGTCRASPRDCAARRARWPRAAPIRRACDSRGRGAFWRDPRHATWALRRWPSSCAGSRKRWVMGA